MKRILITDWMPKQAIEPYAEMYEIIIPQETGGSFSYAEVSEMIGSCHALLVLECDADRTLIEKGKQLHVIASYGVGYNSIDVACANEKGIPVLNTPKTPILSTAEHTIALMTATMRGIAQYDRELRRGIWNSPAFSDAHDEFYGKTLGVLGFGRIGKTVCRLARGLGMHVIYYDKFRASEAMEKEYEVCFESFESVLQNSDVVSLHMPYVPENHHVINAGTLRLMRNGAYLINASRGCLIDEDALAEALAAGVIKGAGLDVFENEPLIAPALLKLKNVTLTPHAASCTMRARLGMCEEALSGITSVLEGGQPENVVNPQVFETGKKV